MANINRHETYIQYPHQCLHEDFFKQAEQYPERIALIWEEQSQVFRLNYGGLKQKALKMAGLLSSEGVKPGDYVAVVLPKGYRQVIAILGILAVGAVYIPIGISQPIGRKKRIFKKAGVTIVVTDESQAKELEQLSEKRFLTMESVEQYQEVKQIYKGDGSMLAYVIFTSGSTGEPKGVMIRHQTAYNTICDVNRRFAVTEYDRTALISELDFDLSVYDIFGLLSVGGSIVIIPEAEKKEAPVWVRLMVQYQVTLWNSVPAIYEMLLTGAAGNHTVLPLRKVFLSGDWIPLHLYPMTKAMTEHCRFISMGGATECSIWSNYWEVSEIRQEWQSIPYGYPLSNQKLRIRDEKGIDCPVGTTGELWIGGAGVAQGYLNDYELTAASFLVIDQECWYRTGDLARYDKDGAVEFLGRKDTQVKVNGYRIELGEIESILRKHSDTESVAVEVVEEGTSKKLKAAITLASVVPAEQDVQVSYLPAVDRVAQEDKENAIERFLLQLIKQEKSNSVVINSWKRWLYNREVLTAEGGEGRRYQEVSTNQEIESGPFGRTIFPHLRLYQRILRGLEDSRSLLDLDELNPEALTLTNPDTRALLQELATHVEEKAASKSVCVAILHARTGLLISQLFALSSGIKVTLIDESSGMLDTARANLADDYPEVDYVCSSKAYVDQQYRNAYDYVLAVNVLHTYSNKQEGLNLAALLLKSSGTLLALEYGEMDALGLITAVVLNDREVSLYGPEQWQEAFARAPYEQIKIRINQTTSAQFIEARAVGRTSLDQLMSLKEYAAENLTNYMQPEEYLILSAMPLTANGKVDRNRVRNLLNSRKEHQDLPETYTLAEKQIASLWEPLLNMEKISRSLSFFEAGGDSLLATRFLASMKQCLGIEMSLKEVFENPKLSQLAEIAATRMSEEDDTIEGEL